MSDIGATHPLAYRQEIAAPLFALVQAGESCALVGSASMGKSRLLHFLLRADVQQHYLGDTFAVTWLVLVDCNRLAEISEWGVYELMLTTLTETAAARSDDGLRDWLNGLRREAITERSALLAQRHMELATRSLCREYGLRLCFVLDEFDSAYGGLPPGTLANLRALRDADRYSVCYVLMLRNHPVRLRPSDENESFYELFSRSVIGLQPYVESDARLVLLQIATRRRLHLDEHLAAEVVMLSGGHPGLLVAIADALLDDEKGSQKDNLVNWALLQPQIVDECRKLWNSLAEDERQALSRLSQDIGAPYAVRELLSLKGLIRPVGPGAYTFFSPLFHEYVLTQGTLSERGLWLDEGAAVIWVEGQRNAGLSPLEFDLLRFLYRRLGQVCTRDEILAALHPEEMLLLEDARSDNRVDSLVRHLRKEIEPDPGHPRYLLTIRGRGYKLIDTPMPAGEPEQG